MDINKIQEDYLLYENGKNYNRRLRPAYYKTIDINESFYANDQWKGVKSKGQPTLIMPVYKRIADHEIASILSAPIKAIFTKENFDSQAENADIVQEKVDMLNRKVQNVWEKDKIDTLLRECLTDGFNSGDYCIYTYWDKYKSTKQYYGKNTDGTDSEIIGDFCNEVKDGSEVMFGNPNDRRVQYQPYILIIGRAMINDLKDEAKLNGVSEDEYSNITSDLDYNEQAGDRGKIELDNVTGETDKCLYIIKLWKKDNKIYLRKSTKFCNIIPEQSMGLNRYPLAMGNWTKRKNSYHGEAPGTAIVPNQIAINQMYSNIAYHLRMTAFGKVIYDSSRIAAWNNAIGSAIGVEGDITGAVQQLQAGQMNTNMFGFISDMVSTTKELNGANDAALGDVNPEQASGTAIMANVQQNAIPLDNPKSNLYQFVEDLVLNWQDFIQNKYKLPRKVGYVEDKIEKVGDITGSDYENMPLSLKVEVGASKLWSEAASVNTIMGLLASKDITFLQALERMPDGYIPQKQQLITEIKAQEELMKAQQQAMTNVPATNQPTNKPDYEAMAQFVDTLSPEVQAEIQKLPDNQYEAAVMQLMDAASQGAMQPQQ